MNGPFVAVLQHAADDGRDFAHARVQVAAVGVGLVPVEEGEPPAADFLFKRMAGPLEERVVDHQRRADQGSQGIVVVAHDPFGTQFIEPIQERQVRR